MQKFQIFFGKSYKPIGRYGNIRTFFNKIFQVNELKKAFNTQCYLADSKYEYIGLPVTIWNKDFSISIMRCHIQKNPDSLKELELQLDAKGEPSDNLVYPGLNIDELCKMESSNPHGLVCGTVLASDLDPHASREYAYKSLELIAHKFRWELLNTVINHSDPREILTATPDEPKVTRNPDYIKRRVTPLAIYLLPRFDYDQPKIFTISKDPFMEYLDKSKKTLQGYVLTADALMSNSKSPDEFVIDIHAYDTTGGGIDTVSGPESVLKLKYGLLAIGNKKAEWYRVGALFKYDDTGGQTLDRVIKEMQQNAGKFKKTQEFEAQTPELAVQ